MDKRVIFAVAGSGKTTFIIEKLNLEKRALVITYTHNNYENLKIRIIEKFGFMPRNITLIKYFGFVYNFCYRPLLQVKIKTKGINFHQPPEATAFFNTNNVSKYIDSSQYLYHNRIAKFLEVKCCIPEIVERIECYFDDFFIDEIQDFAGHDFNFILKLSVANIHILFVGDFFQHTFDTSRDGSVNKNLYKNFIDYEDIFSKMSFIIDKNSLVNSRRCSQDVCDFIKQNLGIHIESYSNHRTQVKIIQSESEAYDIYQNKDIVKLFYDRHHRYSCYSKNWGASKGLDHFLDVCVVLNGVSWKLFANNKLIESNPTSRNKLYVAISRTRGNLYVVSDKFFKKYIKE
jgi:DNA helicase-2/ATP-dependent DNA helicase PcrA